MSHFTVCVRVSDASVAEHGSVEAATTKLLAPYQENNMGDCPEGFLEFTDNEEEYLEEYNTETTQRIKLETGELVLPWDERFRVAGSIGTGSDTHRVPSNLERVNMPFNQVYASLEEYALDWCSATRDPKTGRYGSWDNPNKKWDWWTIGGRWSGFFPIKPTVQPVLGSPGSFDNPPEPGHADVVRLGDIDFDQIAETSLRRATDFWKGWLQLKSTGEDPDKWGSTRSRALSLGLLTVRRGALETADEGKVAHPWALKVGAADSRHSWFDVLESISEQEFFARYQSSFTSIKTYAVLDESGWNAPGEMGWFGCSSDEPENYVKFADDFMAWVRATPDDARIVIVDCHI